MSNYRTPPTRRELDGILLANRIYAIAAPLSLKTPEWGDINWPSIAEAARDIASPDLVAEIDRTCDEARQHMNTHS